MKKFLWLLLVCIAVTGKAQQKELDSLLNELKKHPQEDTVRLNLLNSIAYECNVSNPNKGIQMSDSAILLAGKLNNKKGLATGILNKGINYSSIENNSLALQLYNQALQIARQLNAKPLIAKAYHDIGIYYFDISDYPKAIDFQNKSLAIAAAAHDIIQTGDDYTSIGAVYHSLSIYSESIDYQLKALAIFNKTNSKKEIANVYTNLGLNYYNLQQFLIALDYHKKAFEMHKQSGNKQGMARSLANEANVYDNLNDSAQALRLYHQALAISEEINYQSGITNNTANIGTLYTYYSEYSKAMPYLVKALALYKKNNNKNDQVLILNRLAEVYSNASTKDLKQLQISPQKRYSIALRYNNQALVLAKEINSLFRQAYVLNGIGETYEKEKDYKKALDYHKQADKIDDSIVNDKKNKEITRLEMQYQFNKTQDSVRAVTDKQQALATAQIQKQRILKNTALAGAGSLLLVGIGGFVLYKRNRDIRFKQQITDTEMKALRAQMNPHFIFNSLNSISDFMIKNDTGKADEYLSKFSKLMRLILENSEQKEVSLTEDLKALELYMQLEALRMKNRFTYDIQVADDIDKDNTLIPPLILQPFVENSIWHGLTKKDGEGKIIINIQKENNMLLCTVEDNGIGRETAAVQKQQKKGERKSFGIKITNARIDIINKLKNTSAGIRMFDLAEGTKTEVKLPLELSF